ncbi:serine protease [Photobacterium rosenbergii]|uniref:serine protease n=1 Tax=Photobacterium rosenbergii TaxID=294936 RepID=UPI001F1E8B0F|nr:serine protease [Photobacterium rosenbergii]
MRKIAQKIVAGKPGLARPCSILLATLVLSGCVTSNGPVQQTYQHSANEMVVIGVPMLMGGFGSAVPINDDYMITAKHVAQLSWDTGVIYHPACDLALIPRASNAQPTWGLIYPDQAVIHHGHSLVGTTVSGEGKYLQDVVDTNTDCLYSLSDAPVMSGMSGGPVFNEDGEIAGITVAIVNNPEDLQNLKPATRYSQFVPSPLIFDWLDALGIEVNSASAELAGIKVSDYVATLNRPGTETLQIANNNAQSTVETPQRRTFMPAYQYNTYNPNNLSGLNLPEENDGVAANQSKPDSKLNPRVLLNQSGYNSSF